jgi:hypothetical protein
MNLRDAFLKVADLYERRPSAYNYFATSTPSDEAADKGCPLAWAAFYMGSGCANADIFAHAHLGEQDFQPFSSRMNALENHANLCSSSCWHQDPVSAVSLLRRYVDIYYPEEKTTHG